MYKLLVILFLIKLYALKNIYDYIYGKYGQSRRTLARNTERNRMKIRKLKSDIKFLTTCKKNNLIPTFAKPRLTIKSNIQVKRRVAE